MSGNMERIMREIHVMFAKAEKAASGGDAIIVDKKKVFALLESLNHEVYDAMDRYEETKESREAALKQLKEESDEVIEKTNRSTEEIYAASLLYSDSTLKELEEEVVQAREGIQQTWEEVDRRIGERLSQLSKNRRELKEQLGEMEQSRIYLDLIGKAKRKEAEELEEQKRLNKTARIAEREKQERLKEQQTEEEESSLTEEQKKIEIYVAEAYRDRAAASKEEKAAEEKTEEPESTEGNIQEFRAEDFDLDAEYFAWKEEINGAPAVSYVPDSKKGLKDIFKRVK